ncbi:MAG: FkbM family methyltransferase [Magnetococcus sp. DMHC-8]
MLTQPVFSPPDAIATMARQAGIAANDASYHHYPQGRMPFHMIHVAHSASLTGIIGTDVRIKVTDVGANPIDDLPPYKSLLAAGLAEVVGFEPSPAALATLNQHKGPHEHYLPHAVGDGQRHTLRYCQAPGMTSLLAPNPDVLNLFHGFPDWGKVVAEEEVATVRLDDVAETVGTDLLKMDIQGASLMALEHARARLADVLVVHTEVEFLPMYKDQPLFAEVDRLLRQHGFMVHRFYPDTVSRTVQPLLVNNSPYTGFSQLFWADAIFIRDITRLDLLSDRQLLAMALILHDCYQSLDVVLHLLLEHDRRHNTAHAARYLTHIQVQPAEGQSNPPSPAVG